MNGCGPMGKGMAMHEEDEEMSPDMASLDELIAMLEEKIAGTVKAKKEPPQAAMMKLEIEPEEEDRFA